MTVIRASHVFPITSPPIENGAVEVIDRKIIRIGHFSELSSGPPPIDLGDAVLIPALVNAHTHLEFSWLDQPLGHPGIPFTDWIRQIVAARQTQNQQSVNKSDVIAKGLKECYESGTGLVGEIATQPTELSDYFSVSSTDLPEVTLFLEQLGQKAEARTVLKQQLATFTDRFLVADQLESNRDRLRAGVSPHAPYSVSEGLLNQMLEIAAARSLPVAMHLAETLEEREFQRQLTGPFRDMLIDFGVWDETTFQQRIGIETILQRLSRCSRSLIIHGNYLTDQELDLVAANRQRQSIVYCPRTHDYFRHPTYPLAAMRQRQINVALGTDSRASNPDLDLLQEMKMVHAKFPSIPVNEVLSMGTLHGAKALGRTEQGRLEVGLPASLAVIQRPAGETGPPDQWLLGNNSNCQIVSAI